MSTDVGHYAGGSDGRQGAAGVRRAAGALPAAATRVDALDALRGYAILTMALSGMVPWGTLPQWMYHAQWVVPQMKYDPSMRGLTWVDLVFPFFLFALGASIPLAMAKSLAVGTGRRTVLLGLLRRFGLLAFFAIYAQHVSPHVMAEAPGPREWCLALLGFALLFPVLARWPAIGPLRQGRLTRGFGWVAVAALLCGLNWRSGDSVLTLLGRIAHTSDIILVVLAHMALFGGLAWWMTRGRTLLRAGVMLALVALRMARAHVDWVESVWTCSPVPWVFRVEYLQYLLIVLPGTVVGDILVAHERSGRARAPFVTDASALRVLIMLRAAWCLAMIVLTVIGLQIRRPAETLGICTILGAVGGWFLRPRASEPGGLLRALFGCAMGWLLLGLLCEPLEGGIRKDPATLSYYFVTSGLACCGLLFFHLLIDQLNLRRSCGWLLATGQNPLLAYAGIRSLLAPVVMLTGLERVLVAELSTPWLGVLRAALKTGLLAAFVVVCTRRRVFWRA